MGLDTQREATRRAAGRAGEPLQEVGAMGRLIGCVAASVAVPRKLFAAILEQIARLRLSWASG